MDHDLEDFNKRGVSSHAYQPHETNRNLDEVYKMWKKQEGCRFIASMHMNFLSKSFIIGLSNIRFITTVLQKENKPPRLNFEHMVNSLTFGPSLTTLAAQYKDVLDLEAFDALKGHGWHNPDVHKSENGEGEVGMMHNYFLQVVPNDFSWFFHWVNSFQYNVTHHTLASDDNGILFMFELSPITVKYFTDSPNMFDFLVQISSIIGGIFMFLRVIDMYLFNMFTKFLGGH